MTRIGLAKRLYSSYVGPRPFSRFTAQDGEIAANNVWTLRAIEWAETYMNPAGGLNAAGVQRYVLHVDEGDAQ